MAKFTEIEHGGVLIDLLLNEGWIARPTKSPLLTVLTKTFGERVYNVRVNIPHKTVSVGVTDLHTEGFVQRENSRWLVPTAWHNSENHTIAYKHPYLIINNVKLKTTKRVRFSRNERGVQTFLR